MEKYLNKYLGNIVEIIYLGKNNIITQRLIDIHSIHCGAVKAYCLKRKALRVFRIDRILAVQLASIGTNSPKGA
ncbi:WYL domain-containing protein [Paenibacillus periandrae]|uniref:WYL domain-containing protein n=1 Tax=Paenibacillus periandrae TaxID=1761741 RepID=UPI001F09AF83|nr:WYL domain-containing protein [Paenibacillus periandrae]